MLCSIERMKGLSKIKRKCKKSKRGGDKSLKKLKKENFWRSKEELKRIKLKKGNSWKSRRGQKNLEAESGSC